MHTTLYALGYQIDSIKHQKGINTAFYRKENRGVDKKAKLFTLLDKKRINSNFCCFHVN